MVVPNEIRCNTAIVSITTPEQIAAKCHPTPRGDGETLVKRENTCDVLAKLHEDDVIKEYETIEKIAREEEKQKSTAETPGTTSMAVLQTKLKTIAELSSESDVSTELIQVARGNGAPSVERGTSPIATNVSAVEHIIRKDVHALMTDLLRNFDNRITPRSCSPTCPRFNLTASMCQPNLAIQMMPNINIKRDLVMQHTLNLDIKPTPKDATVAAGAPNVDYRELIKDMHDELKKEVEFGLEARVQQRIMSDASIMTTTGEEDEEEPNRDEISLVRRITRNFEMSTQPNMTADTDTMVMFRNFGCVSQHMPLVTSDGSMYREHPLYGHQSHLTMGTSTQSSLERAGDDMLIKILTHKSALLLNEKFEVNVLKNSPCITGLRDPFEMGFYATKSTQCDDSCFVEVHTRFPTKYARGMYPTDGRSPTSPFLRSGQEEPVRDGPAAKKDAQEQDSIGSRQSSDDSSESNESSRVGAAKQPETGIVVSVEMEGEEEEDSKTDSEGAGSLVAGVSPTASEPKTPDNVSLMIKEVQSAQRLGDRSFHSDPSSTLVESFELQQDSNIAPEPSPMSTLEGEEVVLQDHALEESSELPAVPSLPQDEHEPFVEERKRRRTTILSENTVYIIPEEASRHQNDSTSVQVSLSSNESQTSDGDQEEGDQLPDEEEEEEEEEEEGGDNQRGESFYKMPRARSNTIAQFISGLTGDSTEEKYDEVHKISSLVFSPSLFRTPSGGRSNHVLPVVRNESGHSAENVRANDHREPTDSKYNRMIRKLSKTKDTKNKYFENNPNQYRVETEVTGPSETDASKLVHYKHQISLSHQRDLEKLRYFTMNSSRKVTATLSDPIPTYDSLSEGEINCKCSISSGEMHTCVNSIENEIRRNVRFMKKHPETAVRKAIGERTGKVAKQRFQYDNMISYFISTNKSRNKKRKYLQDDSSSSNTKS